MTSTRTFDALVELTQSIRDTWDTPGIRAAVRQALARDKQPTIAELAYALIRIAENPTVNYPNVVAMDGPHWQRDTTTAGARFPSNPACPKCGDNHATDEPHRQPERTPEQQAEADKAIQDAKAAIRRTKHNTPTEGATA